MIMGSSWRENEINIRMSINKKDMPEDNSIVQHSYKDKSMVLNIVYMF